LPQEVNVPRAAPLVSGACSPALSYNQVANFLVCCDTADEFASLLGGLNRPGICRHFLASNLRPNRRCHEAQEISRRI
jgi:hypothetical protein